jgi:hypothetical protein
MAIIFSQIPRRRRGYYPYLCMVPITDLILAVVELLERDISRLVVEVREALEPVELWDEG